METLRILFVPLPTPKVPEPKSTRSVCPAVEAEGELKSDPQFSNHHLQRPWGYHCSGLARQSFSLLSTICLQLRRMVPKSAILSVHLRVE